jgi:hypothetical protein
MTEPRVELRLEALERENAALRRRVLELVPHADRWKIVRENATAFWKWYSRDDRHDRERPRREEGAIADAAADRLAIQRGIEKTA